MSDTQDFIFSDPSPTAPIIPVFEKRKRKNVGDRPKSLVWETHAVQGAKVSEGHYEATCVYCYFFWRKGSPQDLEAHFANDCSEVPAETRQFFLNRLAAKAERNVTNLEQITTKKRKLNNGQTTQTTIPEFHESSKLSDDRIHEINLISKDICSITFANKILTKCNTIVTYFKRSHKGGKIKIYFIQSS